MSSNRSAGELDGLGIKFLELRLDRPNLLLNFQPGCFDDRIEALQAVRCLLYWCLAMASHRPRDFGAPKWRNWQTR